MPKVDIPVFTVRDYAEQRRVDALNQRADAGDDSYAAARASAAASAFGEILSFLNGDYRPEYLDAVWDRIQRREAMGER